MKMMKNVRRTASLLLTLALTLAAPGKALAGEEGIYLSTYTGESFSQGPSDTAQVSEAARPRAGVVSDPVLPSSWDNRWINRTVTIANQGDFSSCWAFASLGALQCALLPQEQNAFSVDHMLVYSGFGTGPSSGGTFAMALAYLTAWRGPVYESDDPYADGLTNARATVRYHLQEAQLLNGNARAIKAAVMKYGAVQSTMYFDEAIASVDEASIFYNTQTTAYFYNGSNAANHDVMIVGWDDAYPAENFTIKPPADGAFLCQNSWGDSFGSDGFFYVSYYDTQLTNYAIAYTRIDEVDRYDKIYQYDTLGWTAQMGYLSETAFGACVFTAEEDSLLSAVSFYAVSPQTSYELYLDTDPDDTFSKRVLVSSGTFQNAGYYTVDLSKPVSLSAGKDFAIVLKITLPAVGSPFAVEKQTEDLNVITGRGHCYLSRDGQAWVDIGREYDADLCVKAFVKVNSDK